MKRVIIILLTIGINLIAQVEKDDIKKLLVLQGVNDLTTLEAQTEVIYNAYLERQSFQTKDLLKGIGLSAFSGISLGAHESSQFGYKNIGWMPKFLQDWYKSTQGVYSNSVFGDMFTWREVWKQLDYISDRMAYESLNKYFKQKWYWAILTHWVIKNTFATMIRDKMKRDNFFYSWNINFVFSLPK